MRSIPTWALVAVTAVAVVGSGVAVAEMTSGSGAEVAGDPTTTEPTGPVPTTLPDEDSTVEDPAGEETDEESDEAAGGTERYWGPECGEDPTNRGGNGKGTSGGNGGGNDGGNGGGNDGGNGGGGNGKGRGR